MIFVSTSMSGISRSSSRLRLVTPNSLMPQGVMRSNQERSVFTFRAKQWEVIHPDENFFQLAQVGVGVAHFEAQDRVTHDLVGTVEGGIPSPIAPEYLGTQGAQVRFARAQVCRVLRGSSHREDRRMLAQDEGVGDSFLFPEPNEVLLEVPGFGVGRQPGQSSHIEGRTGRLLFEIHAEALDACDAGSGALSGVRSLLVGVVGATDQWTTLHVPEA